MFVYPVGHRFASRFLLSASLLSCLLELPLVGQDTGGRRPLGPDRTERAALAHRAGRVPALPPLTDGTQEFALTNLWVRPIGPKGLEFTAAAKSLEGQRVRVTGFMVRQMQPTPWTFLLTSLPLSLHEREYGYCDDLPAGTLLVSVPRHLPPVLPYERGMLSVTGKLSLGNREEPDGRISTARLNVEPPLPGQTIGLAYVTNFISVAKTAAPGWSQIPLRPAEISTQSAKIAQP